MMLVCVDVHGVVALCVTIVMPLLPVILLSIPLLYIVDHIVDYGVTAYVYVVVYIVVFLLSCCCYSYYVLYFCCRC